MDSLVLDFSPVWVTSLGVVTLKIAVWFLACLSSVGSCGYVLCLLVTVSAVDLVVGRLLSIVAVDCPLTVCGVSVVDAVFWVFVFFVVVVCSCQS